MNNSMNVKFNAKRCQHKINNVSSLEEKIDPMQNDFDKKQNYFDKEKQNFACNECNSLSFQIIQLKRVTER